MGRGGFYNGARKMRGCFPMNLSPGGGHDGHDPFGPFFPIDGYGGPPFHPHGDGPFFPGHGANPMLFNGPGKGLPCMY